MINNALKNILLDTGYFKDNEYLTSYIELVNKNTINANGYKEKHHVIPVSVYRYSDKCKNTVEARKIADTDPKNYTVLLLYKDHVLAHYFLYFCTSGKVKKAMSHAIICMLGNLELDKLDLSEFKYLPEQFEKIQQLIDKIYADPNNNFYTPYEIEFLKLHYSEKGAEWCALALNRPIKLLRAKAHRLRLKINNRGDWLDSELAILSQYYEEYGLKYCKKLLSNRSDAAISCAARKLGLATRHLWTDYEIDFLTENYSKFGGKWCAKALNKTYAAVRNKASALNLAGGNPWQEEELKILKENYHKGASYCTTLIDRNMQAIRTKASELGLSEARSYWTSGEVEILKQYYERFGPKFCVEMLHGHTKAAIKAKANKLGLYLKWSVEEETFLIENYANLGGKRCAKHLSRTEHEVYAKAKELSLHTRNCWTQEEINILKTYYKVKGIKYCAALLKRDRGSIISKAYRLGLACKRAEK